MVCFSIFLGLVRDCILFKNNLVTLVLGRKRKRTFDSACLPEASTGRSSSSFTCCLFLRCPTRKKPKVSDGCELHPVCA